VPDVWRSVMVLLCLIAALAGTPLRQAEAAGDLARSLAELDGGSVVEEIDGGVGDDSGETILKAAGGPSGSLRALNAPAPDDGPGMIHLPTAPRFPLGSAGRQIDPPSFPMSDHLRRRAWLQCLLF
jgi:hypothetical protein